MADPDKVPGIENPLDLPPPRSSGFGGFASDAPPPPPPPQPAASVNGYAIASLVLGLFWLFGVTSVLAIIFSRIASRQIEESNGRETGNGLAIAGLVLGILGVLGAILMIAIVLFAAGEAETLRERGR